jgi:REP element-mobilizing transposase RayT
MKQVPLFSRAELALPSNEHGGSVRIARRKIARPFSSRRPLHVVLQSTRAKGLWSLRRPETDARIRGAIRSLARRHGVRVYEFANSSTHLHLLVRAKEKNAFQAFLRAFAGVTARLVTGARRGRPVGKFWDHLAYTRLVRWGRDFAGVRAYVLQNEMEARGMPYRPRGRGRLRQRSTTVRVE